MQPVRGQYRFAIYLIDIETRELFRAGNRIKLQDQAARLLLLLLASPGKVISREAIGRCLWPGQIHFDSGQAINKAINQIRWVLDDSPRACRFIETVSKQGYRFVAPVEYLLPAPESISPPDIVVPVQEAPAVTDSGNQLLPSSFSLSEMSLEPTPPVLRRYWPVMIISLALAISVAVLWGHKARNRRASTDRATTLLLLPFASSSDLHEKAEWLRFDMADALGHRSDIQIPAVHPSAEPHNAGLLKEVAINSGFAYILDAELLPTATGCVLQGELVQGKNRMHLATYRVESAGCRLSELRERSVNAILVEVAHERLLSDSKQTPEQQAYEAYLQGEHALYKRTDEALNQAVQFFQKAAAIEPNYAAAYAGIANVYLILADRNGMPGGFDMSWRMANRALQLDPGLPEAHAVLGCLALSRNWDRATAHKELQLASDLAPEEASYHVWLASLYSIEHRNAEARAQVDIALREDPYWPATYQAAIFVNRNAGDTNLMLQHAHRLVSLTSTWSLAYDQLSRAQWFAHHFAESLDSADQAGALSGNRENVLSAREGRKAFQQGGAVEYAAFRLKQRNISKKSGIENAELSDAEWAMEAQQPELALRILQRILSEHDPESLHIAADPAFAQLRPDSAFQAILKRINVN